MMRTTAATVLALACGLIGPVAASDEDLPALQPISFPTTGETGAQQPPAKMSAGQLTFAAGLLEVPIAALALVARKNPRAAGAYYLAAGPLVVFLSEAPSSRAGKLEACGLFGAVGIYHLAILSNKERSGQDRFWKSFTAGNLALTVPLLISNLVQWKGKKGSGPSTPEVKALVGRNSVGMSLRW
jgi:hypothetical protein